MRPNRGTKHIKSHFVLSFFFSRFIHSREYETLFFNVVCAMAARCLHDYIVCSRLARRVRSRGGFPILLCKRRVNARELFVTFYLLLVGNGIVRDCNNTSSHYPPPTYCLHLHSMCFGIQTVGVRTFIAVFSRSLLFFQIRECQWLNVSTLKSRAHYVK